MVHIFLAYPSLHVILTFRCKMIEYRTGVGRTDARSRCEWNRVRKLPFPLKA